MFKNDGACYDELKRMGLVRLGYVQRFICNIVVAID
jgi:hypothetical protein